MKAKTNVDLKKFVALEQKTLKRVRKNAETANAAYEKALKTFVVTHITGKTAFKKRFNTEWRELCEDRRHEQAKDFVTNTMVYERMIEWKKAFMDEDLE